LKSHLFPTQTPSLDQLDGNHKEIEKENRKKKSEWGYRWKRGNRTGKKKKKRKKTGEARAGYGTHASPFPLNEKKKEK
jgi:hypothetical protein